MISKSIIRKFIEDNVEGVGLSEFEKVFEQSGAIATLTPVQLIEFILNKLSINHVEVFHQSVSTVNKEAFPGLLFIRGEWCYVDLRDDAVVVSTDDGSERTFDDLDAIPVSVFVGLKEKKQLKSDSYEPAENYETIFAIIKRHALKSKRWISDVIVATVMVNVFTVVTSMFAMQVYDRVVPTLAFATLYTLSIGMIVIYLTDFLLKTSRARLLDAKTSHIDQAVSEEVYDHLLNVQMDRLPNQLGTLTGQISGLESARQFFTSSAVFVLVDFPFCIFFIGMIYIVAGPVAFVYLAFLIVSVGVGLLSQRLSQRLIKKVTSKSNEKLGFLVDSIRGLEAIKTFGGKKEATSRWNSLNKEISNFSIAQKHISTTSSTLASSIGQLAYLMAIIFGVHQISEGLMTQGSMIAVSILGGRVLGPAGQAVSHLIQFENTRQTMELINGLLKLPREKETLDKPVMPMHRVGSIVLKDVKFSYQGEESHQLQIPELEIKAGERVALLGAIGSGKSTLIKILAKLFKPTDGTVKFDKIDLWQIDEYFMHTNVGYHSQNPELFKGTLKDNLLFGRSLPDKHLISIVNDLGIDRIADQSDKGLDRPVSEGGAGLSGGQRQIISLGRVLIGGKNIWLFDEPTASLDNHSQGRFVSALRSRMRDDDILIFSTHNIKLAMEMSNRIIVMDNGTISKDAPTTSVQVKKSA